MFEIPDDSNILRRIAEGAVELAVASVRPLRRKVIRHRLILDFIWMYLLAFLWLHFIGYRSWYPAFHRVHETLTASAISAIPLAGFGAVGSYFSFLRKRNWL